VHASRRPCPRVIYGDKKSPFWSASTRASSTAWLASPASRKLLDVTLDGHAIARCRAT